MGVPVHPIEIADISARRLDVARAAIGVEGAPGRPADPQRAIGRGRHLAVRVVSRSQLHDHELLGLVILKVSVDRDARADRDLLGPQSEIAGAEDVARIADVNEMVAAIGGRARIPCGAAA